MDKLNIYLIISLLLLITGFVSFINSSFFQISEIEISGNQLISEQSIREELDLADNDNIFYLNYQNLVKELVSLSEIKGIRIERRIPNKIRIEINEREPIAIIKTVDEIFMIDQEQKVITYYQDLADKLPKIELDDYDLADGKLTSEAKFAKNFTLALRLLYNLDYRALSEVAEVVFFDEVIFLLRDAGEVRFGEDFDPIKKAELFSLVLADIREKNLQIEYIDLRYGKNTVVKTN